MILPSITVSTFSNSQIWILALVCKNRKIRFCEEKVGEAFGLGKVSACAWAWLATHGYAARVERCVSTCGGRVRRFGS